MKKEGKKETKKIMRILRGSEMVFFLFLMALIFAAATNDHYAFFPVNIFDGRFGILEILGVVYTLWLIFVNWAERKYCPEKKTGIWEIAAILSVGCLVIFRILYTVNP